MSEPIGDKNDVSAFLHAQLVTSAEKPLVLFVTQPGQGAVTLSKKALGVDSIELRGEFLNDELNVNKEADDLTKVPKIEEVVQRLKEARQKNQGVVFSGLDLVAQSIRDTLYKEMGQFVLDGGALIVTTHDSEVASEALASLSEMLNSRIASIYQKGPSFEKSQGVAILNDLRARLTTHRLLVENEEAQPDHKPRLI